MFVTENCGKDPLFDVASKVTITPAGVPLT